jgi:hypothetical protein
VLWISYDIVRGPKTVVLSPIYSGNQLRRLDRTLSRLSLRDAVASTRTFTIYGPKGSSPFLFPSGISYPQEYCRVFLPREVGRSDFATSQVPQLRTGLPDSETRCPWSTLTFPWYVGTSRYRNSRLASLIPSSSQPPRPEGPRHRLLGISRPRVLVTPENRLEASGPRNPMFRGALSTSPSPDVHHADVPGRSVSHPRDFTL